MRTNVSRTTTTAIVTLSIGLPSCASDDLSLGKGRAPFALEGDCVADRCANQQTDCYGAVATNPRCVPAACRGEGSCSPDACEVKVDCLAPCPNDAGCADQVLSCVAPRIATQLRCVKDPNAGIGSASPDACVLRGVCSEP